jgi:hypothetical protein
MTDLNTLTNSELCQHVRSLLHTVEFNRRHTWSGETQKSAEVALETALAEQRRRYGAQAPTTFKAVAVETNHGHYVLRDASWTPYTEGSYADGMNGVLEGVCERGGETSRLFHAVAHRDDAGKSKRFEYAHLTKLWQGYAREDGVTTLPSFHLTSCG